MYGTEYAARRTRTGWVVEIDSNVQGCWTDRRIAYSADELRSIGIDPDRPDDADEVMRAVSCLQGRLLRRGVQVH